MTKLLTVLAVLILIFVSIKLEDVWRQQETKQTAIDKHFPDYFMEDFKLISMDENGQPAYQLSARKMLHYRDDDSAELDFPFIEFDDKGYHWIISAQKAQILNQENRIYLRDNVKILRQTPDQKTNLSVETDYLEFDTQSRIARNDQDTRVKTADMELNSKGILIDNSRGIFELSSQVKGRYVRPQP